jgi:CBS domain-containing protein
MRAADLMTRDPDTCYPLDSLNRAAQIMWERDCGSVPVVDGEGRLVGMITDRDVCMAAYTGGQRLCDGSVSHAMSGSVQACAADDPLEDVLRTMRVHQLRRLPVTSTYGRLVGLISISDLACKLPASSAEAAAALLRTLAAVSTPRGTPDVEMIPAPAAGGVRDASAASRARARRTRRTPKPTSKSVRRR